MKISLICVISVKNGLPSYDTINRIISDLKENKFDEIFIEKAIKCVKKTALYHLFTFNLPSRSATADEKTWFNSPTLWVGIQDVYNANSI